MASATQQLMSTVHWTVAVALGGVVGGAVGSGRMFKLGAAQSAATFLLCGVGECSAATVGLHGVDCFAATLTVDRCCEQERRSSAGSSLAAASPRTPPDSCGPRQARDQRAS